MKASSEPSHHQHRHQHHHHSKQFQEQQQVVSTATCSTCPRSLPGGICHHQGHFCGVFEGWAQPVNVLLSFFFVAPHWAQPSLHKSISSLWKLTRPSCSMVTRNGNTFCNCVSVWRPPATYGHTHTHTHFALDKANVVRVRIPRSVPSVNAFLVLRKPSGKNRWDIVQNMRFLRGKRFVKMAPRSTMDTDT